MQPNLMTIPAKYENGAFAPSERWRSRRVRLLRYSCRLESQPARKRPSIKDLPFYGMWADREDITHGVSHVNALRNNPRG
jgi:hypothetical protein